MRDQLARIEKQIDTIKRQLLAIGEMRPGSLTCQYRSPQDKKGAFYQISYTYNMRSRTEYVRKEFIPDLSRQVKNFKRFKLLTNRWVDLALKHSQLKIALTAEKR